MQALTHSQPATQRSAFTLLELLIVIVIIGILLSLLFPVIGTIFGRSEQASVVAEMSQLDQALQAFSSKYGEYPPSNLSIPLLGDPWTATNRAKVKAIWPQFNFATNGGLNNDGMAPNPGAIHLNGAECLVFFLGGLQSGDASAPVLTGFARNPREPWPSANPPTNPDGPFMEFDLGRIVNVDGDSAFEYADPFGDQSTPYLYISAAGKRINRDNDNYLLTLAPQSDTAAAANDDYDVFTDATRNLSACYLKPDEDNDGSGASDNIPYKKDGFQLISPGEDGEYGTGGVWQNGESLDSSRDNETDNITNFSSGPLQP